MRIDTLRRLVTCSLLCFITGIPRTTVPSSWAQERVQGACTLSVGKRLLRGDLGTEVSRTGRTVFLDPQWTDEIHFNLADSGLHFSVGVDRVASVFVSDRRFPGSTGTCAGERQISLIVSDGREFKGCIDTVGRLKFRSNETALALDLLDELFPAKVVCNEEAPKVQAPPDAKAPAKDDPALRPSKEIGKTEVTDEAPVPTETVARIRQDTSAAGSSMPADVVMRAGKEQLTGIGGAGLFTGLMNLDLGEGKIGDPPSTFHSYLPSAAKDAVGTIYPMNEGTSVSFQ